jgi:hypothetical protein
MPLKKGRSPKVISSNISEMMKKYERSDKIGTSKPSSKGKALDQAVAISLSSAGKKKMKTGGAAKGRMGPVATVKKRDGNKPVKIY